MFKKEFIYLSGLVLLLTITSTGSLAGGNPTKCGFTLDTIIQSKDSFSTSIIDEIVLSKNAPDKEKVQLVSTYTQYGFKNLFKEFSYNSTLSYGSQVNPHAELYMQDYLRLHQKQLVKMKGWGVPYFNLIDQIFKQYGLPAELKYLAVIESSLQTKATSWVGAAGPWQFMPATGRIYGLRITRQNDERRDYFKSTHAAARMLLSLYKEFDDWLLVIAAYNGGSENVKRAIRKSGGTDFWRLQYYLPQESRNHVKKFIATHYVMETGWQAEQDLAFYDPAAKSIEQSKPTEAGLLQQSISGKYIGSVIAKNVSIDLSLFNRYNPGFDKKISQEGTYDLRLPEGPMKLFRENKYQILEECVQVLLNETPLPGKK
jgi:membrane-bound lytic murein transglycosylase D